MKEYKSQWQQLAAPETEIEVATLLKGVETIESIYDAELAAPFILEQVKEAQDSGVDGIVIHCMVDPALQAAWEVARIPVIGEGLACFATALVLGDRFSIISPNNGEEMLYRSRLRAYKLEDHLASIHSLGLSVVDLRKDLAVLRESLLANARVAVEKFGADVIIPGCGEIYGLADDLSEDLGIPVLDPRATVVKFAEMLVSMRLCPSKHAYPYPSEKRREM